MVEIHGIQPNRKNTMTHAILTGLGIGLIISVLAGPVFFALLQTAIQRGLSAGILMSTGILISDLFIVGLLFFGVNEISGTVRFENITTLFSGLFLLFLGTSSLLQKKKENTSIHPGGNLKTGTAWMSFLKGVSINTMHPGVWLCWLGVISIVGVHEEIKKELPGLILVIAVLVIYLVDILKAYLAVLLQKHIRPNWVFALNRVIGIVLAVCGLNFLYRFILMH